MNELVPEGWSVSQLSRICNIVGGGTPERAKSDYWGGDIPWVSPTEVTSLKSRYITKSKEKITHLGLDKSSAKLHPVGTVLMTSRASIGYVAINTLPVATNQGFQSLQCKDGIYNEYLYQHITWIRPELENLSAGSTFSEISLSTLKKVQMTLPPLPEQKKIAAILTSVDEVIEKTQAQINKLKDLKTGMMQELLTRGVGVDGKPHTEFMDTPVGRIPKGWKVKSIGDLFRVQLGKMLSKKSKVGDCPLPYLGNKNVQWGKFDLTNIETMDFSEKEITKFSLKRGDLLMCEGGEVGRCAIWNNEIVNCYYQKALHRLRPIDDGYDSFLLMEYMKFAKQNGLLVDYISQTSIAHLTKEKLISIPVPVPPREEQRKIALALKTITLKLETVEKKLDKTGALKKALMQDLLTGKVRVKVDS